MKIIKYLTIILAISLLISGCGIIYEKQVDSAYSKLKIGMTKNELDNLFKDAKFLKEQTVLKYPNATEDSTRMSLRNNKSYDDLYPKDILEKITFNGNTKVFSYLIKKELNWPNGWYSYYVAVFYDSKIDKVIGWAKIFTIKGPDTWRDSF